MYGWIWRTLPGGRPWKLVGSFVLLVAALAEPRLPFNHVNVDPGSGTTPAPTPSVTTAPTTAPTTQPSTTALPGD
jgi:hypothetical protein